MYDIISIIDQYNVRLKNNPWTLNSEDVALLMDIVSELHVKNVELDEKYHSLVRKYASDTEQASANMVRLAMASAVAK